METLEPPLTQSHGFLMNIDKKCVIFNQNIFILSDEKSLSAAPMIKF